MVVEFAPQRFNFERRDNYPGTKCNKRASFNVNPYEVDPPTTVVTKPEGSWPAWYLSSL